MIYIYRCICMCISTHICVHMDMYMYILCKRICNKSPLLSSPL